MGFSSRISKLGCAGRVLLWRLLVGISVGALLSGSAAAADVIGLSGTLVGSRIEHVVRKTDSLSSIGARFGVPAATLARDNGLPPGARLKPGSTIVIDNRHIAPPPNDAGIIVNIPQRMLFLYNGGAQSAYPVALGKPDWPTPTGDFKVVSRTENKTWIVPKSIQDEMRREGKVVKTRVPPGPDNPLGRYWLGLSLWGYGIHGTIAPQSIYRFVSHGCIRMHPDDIATVFGKVTAGMPGALVYWPVLLARLDDGRIFVEIHPDPYKKGGNTMETIRVLAISSDIHDLIDWWKVKKAITEQAGIAREVGWDNPPSPPPSAPAQFTADRQEQ